MSLVDLVIVELISVPLATDIWLFKNFPSSRRAFTVIICLIVGLLVAILTIETQINPVLNSSVTKSLFIDNFAFWRITQLICLGLMVVFVIVLGALSPFGVAAYLRDPDRQLNKEIVLRIKNNRANKYL